MVKECLFLRGSCGHAKGMDPLTAVIRSREHKSAVGCWSCPYGSSSGCW